MFLLWFFQIKLIPNEKIIRFFSLSGFQSPLVRHRQTFCGEPSRDRHLVPAEHLRAHLLPLQRGALQALRASRPAGNLRSGHSGSGKFSVSFESQTLYLSNEFLLIANNETKHFKNIFVSDNNKIGIIGIFHKIRIHKSNRTFFIWFKLLSFNIVYNK